MIALLRRKLRKPWPPSLDAARGPRRRCRTSGARTAETSAPGSRARSSIGRTDSMTMYRNGKTVTTRKKATPTHFRTVRTRVSTTSRVSGRRLDSRAAASSAVPTSAAVGSHRHLARLREERGSRGTAGSPGGRRARATRAAAAPMSPRPVSWLKIPIDTTSVPAPPPGQQVDVVELVERPDEAQHREQRDDARRAAGAGCSGSAGAAIAPSTLRGLVEVGRHGLEPGEDEEEREREVAPRLEDDDARSARSGCRVETPRIVDVARALAEERDRLAPSRARPRRSR